MVEQRQLTQEELDRLIAECEESERQGVVSFCATHKMTPYELFKFCSFDWDGVVVNNRPIYVAGIFNNGHRFELWTIVNSNVKEQVSLFKATKRGLNRWLGQVHIIYATMMKSWEKNRFWTERLGFKPCSETENTITYVIKA